MAASRVIQSTGADGLTGAQRNQLNTDRQIRQQRETNEAANKLAQIEAQNQGQRDTTFLAATGALARENLSQQGATQRQGMADTTTMASTKMRETAETGRNTDNNASALDRLAKGHGFAMEQATQKEKFDAAGDQRKAATQALIYGVPGAQVNNIMNANPGSPVDFKGVQVPLRNSQQDTFQGINTTGDDGKERVMVLNKQTGALSPAATALSSGQQQPAQQQLAGQTGKPQAPDAFAKIYESNPQQLQADTDFAASQIGTVYKTDEEQLTYLNSVRKTNPTLFQSLKQRLGQQPAAR